VGWCAALLGDYDTARDHCEAALDLYRRHDDISGEAATLDSLGYIDHRSGRHTQALEHYRQALALFRELGNTFLAADCLTEFGHLQAAVGQHEHARTTWREALQLCRDQGRDDDAAQLQRRLDDLDTRGEDAAGP
jgi:tetratricopeptide (TPR) repeat protein